MSRLTKRNLFIVCINSSYTSDSGKKEKNGILYPISLVSPISGSETMSSEKALPILLLIALIVSSIEEYEEASVAEKLPAIRFSELNNILVGACALLCAPPCSHNTKSLLVELQEIFQEDSNVFVGQITLRDAPNITWTKVASSPSELAFYKPQPKDRTCLLSPPKSAAKAEPYAGPMTLTLLVQFLNEKCNAYRTAHGSLNSAGMFHAHIMSQLYLLEENGSCPRIGILDQPTFFQQYILRSRPVVIEGAAKVWPALSKWTMSYLKDLYGSLKIHIKLTKDGNFEGVENASLWDNHRKDWIPEKVASQLAHPDLVVVRPATTEMQFSKFLDYIVSESRSYSAYLEYSSIPGYLPLLEKDISEMPFVAGLLKRRHLNIWLSDGNTLGKLHFDPYDNFLCQVGEFPSFFPLFSIQTVLPTTTGGIVACFDTTCCVYDPGPMLTAAH